MKRILAAFVALASAAAVAEEEHPEAEVLISGHVDHGGYGGPEMRFTTVRGEGAVLLGGRGGWIIDHTFVIGGAGYGLVNRIAAPDSAQPASGRYDLNFGYGGVFIEGIILPRNLWHLSVASLFGGGGVGYMDHDLHDAQTHATAAVFVWEPSATFEFNVVKFLRIDLGASYRLVRGVDLAGLRNADLSGFSGMLAFKFGRF
jgi:hypothetical protein